MAKDPAFLFYSSDFFMGTIEMSDAQVGQYTRLLCLQHIKGHLNEAIMKSTMNGTLDPMIANKFILDEEGLYYNVRLDAEVVRRQKYSESRRSNLSKTKAPIKKSHMDGHMASHMEPHMDKAMTAHMETETETETITNNITTLPIKDIKPTKHKHGLYHNVLLTDDDLSKLKTEFTDYLERIDRLSEYIESKGVKYKSHLATIRAWARKDKADGVSGHSSEDSRTGLIQLDNGMRVERL